MSRSRSRATGRPIEGAAARIHDMLVVEQPETEPAAIRTREGSQP